MSVPDAQRAAEHLQKLGIARPRRPKTSRMPKLPANLGDLAPAQVTQQMNKWSQWLAYIKTQLALAEIRWRQAEDRYKKKVTVELVMAKSGAAAKATITSLRAEIEVRDDVLQMSNRERVLDAKRKLLLAVHDGADQNYKLLSRELTRRTNVYDRGIE